MKRRGSFNLPLVILDRASPRPLYRQVQDVFISAIRSGALPAGARLPSTRALAKLLGVSRNTVLEAYNALAAADLVNGMVGSGTRVADGVVRPGARRNGWDVFRTSPPARAIEFVDPDGTLLYLH